MHPRTKTTTTRTVARCRLELVNSIKRQGCIIPSDVRPINANLQLTGGLTRAGGRARARVCYSGCGIAVKRAALVKSLMSSATSVGRTAHEREGKSQRNPGMPANNSFFPVKRIKRGHEGMTTSSIDRFSFIENLDNHHCLAKWCTESILW